MDFHHSSRIASVVPKKHTKLLEAIKVATGKTPTVQVSGNVDAVIGR